MLREEQKLDIISPSYMEAWSSSLPHAEQRTPHASSTPDTHVAARVRKTKPMSRRNHGRVREPSGDQSRCRHLTFHLLSSCCGEDSGVPRRHPQTTTSLHARQRNRLQVLHPFPQFKGERSTHVRGTLGKDQAAVSSSLPSSTTSISQEPSRLCKYASDLLSVDGRRSRSLYAGMMTDRPHDLRDECERLTIDGTIQGTLASIIAAHTHRPTSTPSGAKTRVLLHTVCTV